MLTGRFQLFAAFKLLALASLGSFAGCAQSGPIATHRNTVGMLKQSVSQLEYSNDNLKKQVAELKSDSSRAETELVQERNNNGELTARLDDAKDALRKEGKDVTALNRPIGSASKASTASADDEIPAPRSQVQRSSRRNRKPPSAAIPPKIESSVDNGPGALQLPSEPNDPGPQASRSAEDGTWLRVTRGRSPSRRSSVEVY